MALVLLVANSGWMQGLFHFYRTFAILPPFLQGQKFGSVETLQITIAIVRITHKLNLKGAFMVEKRRYKKNR